jgi:integrase
MARSRISKKLIDGLRPSEREFVVWDTALPGFGVRMRPSGAASYVVQYRDGKGREAADIKFTLGSVGKLTPDEARAKARAEIGKPAAERAGKREALTVKELAATFMAEHVGTKRKPATAELYRHVLDSYVIPALGKKKAADLTKGEVARLHHDLRDRPYLANRALAVVGSLYSWADKRGLVPEGFNPTARIEKFAEAKRERFLTSEELARLGEAIREAETVGIPWEPDPEKKVKHAPKVENRRSVISSHAAAAIRLLLFTGARLREILHLRWEHVDLDRGLLLLPDSKTGRKTIVLNAPALVILNDLVRVGGYVIAGESAGTKNEKPRSDLKRPWSLVARRAGLTGVRIHDLRHSFASVGAGGGLGLPMIGKLLGHTQPQTTARYAHLDADPLRRASDAIASTIAAALEGRHAVPATPMRRRAE